MNKLYRCFLLISLISNGLFGQSSKRPFSGWAILQGPTTASDTVFAVLHKADEALGACSGTTLGQCEFQPKEVVRKARPNSDWTVTHFTFKNLPPKKVLTLKIEDGKKHSDVREFELLSRESSLKFGVASCMDDTYTDIQEPMWKSVLEKKPDVLFFIGDNVYADKHVEPKTPVSPEILWRRYAETRETLAVFHAPKLVPIFAVWDDHDFGLNDGDGSYPYKNESREIFFAFFPQKESSDLKLGPGVSSSFTLAEQDFFFMDDRFFRSKETHWGKEQEDWLFKQLKANKRPAWLINGDQFFGGYHPFESFEGRNPDSFKKFKKMLQGIHKPINFISGDRHLAEVMKIEASQIGREAFELTSSGIHAKVFADAFERNKSPRQVAGVAGEYNYMIVEASVKKGELSVTLAAYGKEKKYFEYKFKEK